VSALAAVRGRIHMPRFLTRVAAAGVLTFSFTAHATIIQTIDLLPIDGTTLADVTSPGGVIFNFGSYGKGHLTFSALTGGAAFSAPTLQRIGFINGTTLDNGNQFISNNELVFDLRGNNVSFVLNVTLDAGVLPNGSLFEIRSLDRNGLSAQYFLPGAGMGAADSHQLASDGSVPLLSGVGGEFSASSDGISKGRVWDVGGVSAFSGTFRQDTNFGGVAFTIAVAKVPEPGSVALLVAGLGVLAGMRRARRI
jgi:hypothetical protein